jgi:ABC-type dipeptide/oligopeptide/nickel transport system permease component
VVIYIGKRLLALIVLLFGISILVFLMLQLIPGSPVTALLGQSATNPAAVARLTQELGLNRPLPVQYWHWLENAVRGNFGYSYNSQQPVSALLAQNLPATLELAGAGLLISLVGGIVLGAVAAVRRNTAVDSVSMGIAMTLVALPSFWLGLVLILAFAVALPWFPVVGGSSLRGLVLPAFTLGLGLIGITGRFVRSSLLEAMHSPHVAAARAKGLTKRTVFVRHIARNALLPVLTVIGLQVGSLLSGTVLVEVVFSRPGIGRLLVQSILSKDYATVQATVLIIASFYAVTNLIVDLLYPLVDPRVGGM